jgi:hypothetical protein
MNYTITTGILDTGALIESLVKEPLPVNVPSQNHNTLLSQKTMKIKQNNLLNLQLENYLHQILSQLVAKIVPGKFQPELIL